MRDGQSRREFLTAAGVAAVALAAGASNTAFGADVAPADAPKKRALKKAVMYGMIGEGKTVREKFAVLKEAGFDGVEMDSPTNLSIDEIKKAAEETGILVEGVVDSVHWTQTLTHNDPKMRERGVEGLKTALRDCAALGGTSVLLVPGVVDKSVSYDVAWKRSQEEIRKCIPLAREVGVKIAVENVWNQFLLSPLEAARFIDDFAADDVMRWHFDIGNVINYGWPEQWIRILGKRIFKTHVKEFSRTKRDKEGLWKGFAVELTEGDNDWPAVMKALDEVGYSGWFCAEVGGGNKERLKQVAARMDKILAM